MSYRFTEIDEDTSNLSFSLPLKNTLSKITISDASTTQSGVINTTTQSFSGAKTFNSLPKCSVIPSTNSDLCNKSYIDTLVNVHVHTIPDVISFYDFTNPPSATSSDRYIALTTVGDFSQNNIYTYDGTLWDEYEVSEGDSCYISSDLDTYFPNQVILFNGSSWVNISSTITHDSLMGVHQSVKTTDSPSFSKLTISSTDEVTSTSTGALIVNGGANIIKNLYVNSTTNTVSTSTGATIIAGGVGIAKKLYIGDSLNVFGVGVVSSVLQAASVTDSNNIGTGSFWCEGGASIRKNTNVGGNMRVYSTTDSSSTSTGSTIIAGGAGISKNLFVGSDTNISGILTSVKSVISSTENSTDSLTGSLTVAGGMGIAKNLFVGSDASILGTLKVDTLAENSNGISVSNGTTFTINDSTDSAATNAGSLIVSGGVGIAKNLNVGGITNVVNTTESTSITTGAVLVSGGVGVIGNMNVGGSIYQNNLGSLKIQSYGDSSIFYLSGQNIYAENTLSSSKYKTSGNGTTDGTKITITMDDDNLVYPIYNNGSAQTGCIRFKWTASYNNAPSTAYYAYFLLGNKVTPNRIFLNHWTNSDLMINAWNSSGVRFLNSSVFGKFYPVLGTEYDIELNWDFTNGDTKVFINGAQLGNTKTDIQTRNNVDDISISYGGNTADCIIRDFSIFNTVQHTTDFTIKSLPIMSIIDENITTNGYIKSNLTTQSTSISTGSLIVSGGVGIAKNLYIGGNLNVSGTTTSVYDTMSISSTTDSSNSLTGSLTVSGGVGIAKNLNVGANFSVNGVANISVLQSSSTTDSASTNLGSLIVSGGTGIAKNANVGGNLKIYSTLDSSSSSTGSVIVKGGIGIAKKLYVGSDTNISGTLTSVTSVVSSTENSTDISTGALTVAGGMGIAKDLFIGGTTHVVDTTESTSTSTGSTIIAGGMGIAKNLNVSNLTVNSTNDSTSSTTGSLIVNGGCGIAKDLFVGGNFNIMSFTSTLTGALETTMTLYYYKINGDIYLQIPTITTTFISSNYVYFSLPWDVTPCEHSILHFPEGTGNAIQTGYFRVFETDLDSIVYSRTTNTTFVNGSTPRIGNATLLLKSY
jgi:hypothetical protein